MCGSPDKLRRDTGWVPETPWEDTLRDLLNHYLLNPGLLNHGEGGGS
jgi:nucleoside-diphosphate-sugar epimerase